MFNYSGIYKLYWTSNGSFYIGQALNITHRYNVHICSLKKNKNSRGLQRIFNKCKELPLIKVIEYCAVDQLDSREQHYLDTFFGTPGCCNIAPVASSAKGIKRSDEFKKKRSDYMKNLSEEQKKKFATNTGKKFSDEHRRRIAAALTGHPNKGMVGKKMSEAYKKQKSDSMKKVWETRKISKGT